MYESDLTARDTGERIAIYRKRKNLSQKELARIIGVSPATVCNYESGKTSPNMIVLTEIAVALDVTVNMILFGCEPEKAPIIK